MGYGGHETPLAPLRATTAERVPGRLTRVGTVKVRCGPQHGNAVEIHQPGDGPAGEGHVGGVILLLGGAIGPFAARPQRGPCRGPFAQLDAVKPGVARHRVALNDTWRALGLRVGIAASIGPRSRVVVDRALE